jgi:DNA-binding response OmpR family regulator
MDKLKPVLVVRDSVLLNEASSELLQRTDSTVVTAYGYNKTVEAAETVSPQFILLDVTAPEPSVLDALRALKLSPLASVIPVIIVSSLSERQSIPLLDEGAVGFCHRASLTAEVLDSVVNNALRRACTPRMNQIEISMPHCSVELAAAILVAIGLGPNNRVWPVTPRKGSHSSA